MLWKFVITGTKEYFRSINTLGLLKKYIGNLWGLLPIHLTRRRGAQGLMWGARGAFLPAAAMVVAVVMPVVFCPKATEKRNKNTKISCLLPKSFLITIYCETYCNSYITNFSVAEPELGCGQSPNHFGPMDSGILGIAGKLLSFGE
jgi:hypothetical protein